MIENDRSGCGRLPAPVASALGVCSTGATDRGESDCTGATRRWESDPSGLARGWLWASLRRVAFWAAVALPFLYVPLLATGIGSRVELLAFAGLVAAQVATLLVGHCHLHPTGSAGSGSTDPAD